MAYKIDVDACISCGACAADCPVDAISEGDAAYVIDALRLGYYKIYYPYQFYAAFFTAAPDGFDGETVMAGRASVLKLMERSGSSQ